VILYMIRHGESEANVGRFHAGWAQISLTQKGVEQAKETAKKLRNISFDRVICSDLKRAIQTCELIFSERTYETNSLLREINVGVLSGKNVADCQHIYGMSYTENKRRQDFTPYGGENRAMLLDRIRCFINEAEEYTEKRVAVFAHEGPIRAMLDLVTGQAQRKECFVCKNCSIAIFRFQDELWQLVKWGV